ncbi:MAG: hypothetical protein AABX51_06360, partial [Nanoarchaeota archaeon]
MSCHTFIHKDAPVCFPGFDPSKLARMLNEKIARSEEEDYSSMSLRLGNAPLRSDSSGIGTVKSGSEHCYPLILSIDLPIFKGVRDVGQVYTEAGISHGNCRSYEHLELLTTKPILTLDGLIPK